MTIHADIKSYFSTGRAEAGAELELGMQIELDDSVSCNILNISEDKMQSCITMKCSFKNNEVT